MAKEKKEVLRALSNSHLRAIGMVAAQWNALELTLLHAIARTACVDLRTSVILAGSQNATTWFEMLSKLTGQPLKKSSELGKLKQRVSDAQTQRNAVVHATWHPRKEIRGGLLGEVAAPPMKASDKARGTGVPKRGTTPFTVVELSATDMLAIAKEIEAIETNVFEWLHRTLEKPRLTHLLPLQSSLRPHGGNRLLELMMRAQLSQPEYPPGSSVAA